MTGINDGLFYVKTPMPSPLQSQVCSYDRFNRHTCEGYGWTTLADAGQPSSRVSYVNTWKPQGALSPPLLSPSTHPPPLC